MTLLSKIASIIYNSVQHKLKHTVSRFSIMMITPMLLNIHLSANNKLQQQVHFTNISLDTGMLHYGLAPLAPLYAFQFI